MPEFSKVRVEAQPYAYVERSTSMDPDEIGAAMADALMRVATALGVSGVVPTGALSVYSTYRPDGLDFRAGFLVADGETLPADGEVRIGRLPSGEVLHFLHVGPYATLRDYYRAAMEWMDRNGLVPASPTWEVYLDPPESPQDRTRTEVCMAFSPRR